VAASSAGSVAFSFIHTNDMPLFAGPALSLRPENVLRRGRVNHRKRVVSCELP
jgi:hypothetical protein